MNRLAFKPRTATGYHARINRVLTRISDDLDAPLGTEDLAGVANLSAFHFHRIFRAITGETVAGLVRRLRLDRAGQALRRGEPLIEVALGAHYGSPEAFGRAFRDAFGLTPTAYRRAMPPPPQRPPLSLAILLDLNTFALSLEPLEGGTAMEVRIESSRLGRALSPHRINPYWRSFRNIST
jgi:AraC family transcriptional regulator